MKAQKIAYWISTVLLAAFMAVVAIAYLAHLPKINAAFSSLGYPPYFQNILGLAKLLGAITLLVRGMPILKEWAYAGFTFTFIGALISHLAVNQTQEAVGPVIALIILAISYFLRPANRRLHFATYSGSTRSPDPARWEPGHQRAGSGDRRSEADFIFLTGALTLRP